MARFLCASKHWFLFQTRSMLHDSVSQNQNTAFCGLRRGSLPGVKDSCEISIWKVSCDGTMDEPEVEAAESAEPGSGMMKLWLFLSLALCAMLSPHYKSCLRHRGLITCFMVTSASLFCLPLEMDGRGQIKVRQSNTVESVSVKCVQPLLAILIKHPQLWPRSALCSCLAKWGEFSRLHQGLGSWLPGVSFLFEHWLCMYIMLKKTG